MSLKITLALLLAASATLAKGQNNPQDSVTDNYHIFFPAQGKDILAAHIGGHSYKIVNLHNKPAEVYVDNQKVPAGELSKYDAIIDKIKASLKVDGEARDMAQMERDREQAERDREQTQRDGEQAARDREQSRREREQFRHEQEQTRHEQEQAHRERQQAERDREQRFRDVEQAEYDGNPASNGQCECDGEKQMAEQRQQSAQDRTMVRKGIQVLVDEHIIPNARNLQTLVLTNSDLSVNGTKQPQNVYRQVRNVLGDWARNGFSYGGTTEDHSLSIND